QVLRQPALATDPRFASNALRNQHRAELRALIVAAFSDVDAQQVTARLDAAGIANARVNTMADVWAHPQLAARGRMTQVDSPAGPLQALRPPGVHSSFEPRMDAVPAIGQHTEAILRELGLADGEIAALRARQAI
ncbi:MAG TPA: CoA transferase, partial [Ramlibacter sp.]|nr:CoA transferase [Ramlibacter sp.]